MKKTSLTLSALLTLCVTISAYIPTSSAQNNEDTCYERIANEMVTIHDEWRSRLFGSRRGTDGKIIVLTGGATDEIRTGIFETKHRLTSELIEPIIESYRVYRCRTLAVCQIAVESFGTDGGNFDLKLLGCAERNIERYNECYFGGDIASGTDGELQATTTSTARKCSELADQTLAGEISIVRLAVAYDAGYRSLLQLSGMVDWMLQGFPTETVKAIADMVNMLGKLHQIPCFIGQCDNPDTSGLTP